MKILIVDSNPEDTNITVSAIKISWPDAEICRCVNGNAGLQAVGNIPQYDLIIVDLDLPDISGFEFLESLFLHSSSPTIALKRSMYETDIVRSLQLGADECMEKPIRQIDFVVKSQAVVRRYFGRNYVPSIAIGKLRLEAEIHRAYVDGQEITLTSNENIVMGRLMQNYGRITSYANISRAIWGNYVPQADSALRVCIRRLRNKLPFKDCHIRIVTERGVGLRLVVDK